MTFLDQNTTTIWVLRCQVQNKFTRVRIDSYVRRFASGRSAGRPGEIKIFPYFKSTQCVWNEVLNQKKNYFKFNALLILRLTPGDKELCLDREMILEPIFKMDRKKTVGANFLNVKVHFSSDFHPVFFPDASPRLTKRCLLKDRPSVSSSKQMTSASPKPQSDNVTPKN